MSGNDYSRFLSGNNRSAPSGVPSTPGFSSHSRTRMGDSSGAIPDSRIPSPSSAPPLHVPLPEADQHQQQPVVDDVSIAMLLSSPGHDRLPHLHPDRPPNTLWFDEYGSVAATVRIIFERDFKEPHANWKQTPFNVVNRWFNSFAQIYHWDSGLTKLVRDSFEAKLKVQLSRQVSRWKGNWRKKGNDAMPVWFDPIVWDGLVAYWEDPGTEARSSNSRTARYSDPDGYGPSKHRSGQTSFRARARHIAEETGCTIPDLLGVLEKTKRKPDGTFLDAKAEHLYNEVTSRFEELSQVGSEDPESTGSGGLSPAAKNKIYCELAPRKKERIYGTGSIMKSVASTPTFSSSSSDDQSLKKIIEEQALLIHTQNDQLRSQGDQIGKLNAVVQYLASKDSGVANIFQTHTAREDQSTE